MSTFLTRGNHFIVELSGCSANCLSNLSFVEETLVEGVRLAKATLLNQNFYKFSPQGVSGILLLSESHCSIHTWPEEEYAAIDIYTCGDHAMPEVACAYIAEKLQAKRVFATRLSRGLFSSQENRYQHEIMDIGKLPALNLGNNVTEKVLEKSAVN
jgi:S-adenosylmethionine decarboxylase